VAAHDQQTVQDVAARVDCQLAHFAAALGRQFGVAEAEYRFDSASRRKAA
jgi:hypothetical protein